MNKNSKHLTIRELAQADRPREKLIKKGCKSLSNAELLAIVLGSGNKTVSAIGLAQQILHKYGQDLNQVLAAGVLDLCNFNGVGTAKAVAVLASLELGKRSLREHAAAPLKIKSSQQVYQCMEPELSALKHEEFWVLYLNNANRVLQKSRISKGGYTGTLVDLRIILKEALQLQAVALILVHNHPSGTLKPSKADINMTQKIKQAAASIDIGVLDHIIFTEKAYFSFADQQML